MTPGWSISANTTVAGQIRLGLASPGGTVSGSGVLANLEFEVIGAPGQNSQLKITEISLNDGAIPAQTAEATFNVELVYSVAGQVQYWKASEAVANVALTLTGDRVYSGISATDETYAVNGAPAGDYTLVAEKTDGVKGISAYDASLVLQHAVGLISLAGNGATAADVDKSRSITTMDAFYILQKAVELIVLSFPGAGVVWDFVPQNRTYTNLSQNQTGQDFTAVLLGDVTGNWNTAEAGGIQGGENPAILYLKEALPTADGARSINVSLDPQGNAVYSLDMTLWFNSADITLKSVDVAAAGSWNYSVNIGQDGLIRLALARATAVTEPGNLLTFNFYPPAVATRSIDLQPLTYEINENYVPASYVKIPMDVLPPGDVNGDGNVTIADAILALQITVGMSKTPAAGANVYDANGDYRIGMEDAILILQQVSGLRQ